MLDSNNYTINSSVAISFCRDQSKDKKIGSKQPRVGKKLVEVNPQIQGNFRGIHKQTVLVN